MAEKDSRLTGADIYNVVDKKGNVVDTLSFPEGGSLQANAAENTKKGATNTVYRNTSGTGEKYEPLFTAEDIKKATSITLNKKTGDITLNAPSALLKNESFIKQNYGEALKSISQAYKIDSKQKFSLLQNNNEKKTPEEWLKDFEKNLKEDIPKYIKIGELKKYYRDKDGVKLTDEDLVAMRTAAVEYNDETGETVKVSKNTLQVIPESLMTLPVFGTLKDEWEKSGAHTVTWGSLSEVWDRDKTSDEDIHELYDAVEKYFKDKNFSNSREYAEMTALATFLEEKDPSVNFWRGTAEVLGEGILGIITGAAEFDVRLMSAIEGGVNWVQNMGETIYATEQGADWGAAWKNARADDKTFIADYWVPEMESWTERRHTDLSHVNDAAAAAQTITTTLTPIAMQLATSVAAGKAAADYTASTIGRVVTSIASKYGETAQSLSMLTVANIASGAISVEEVATGLYAGTEIMLTLSDAATAATTALKAIETVRAVSRVAGAVTKMSDIAAQAIVDVTLSDPKLFRQLLETDDAEAKSYAMQQLTINAAGEVGAVALGRAMAGFNKTDIGRVLNVQISGRISALKANVGQTVDNIKIALHGGDAEWLLKKRDKLAAEANKAAGTWLEKYAWNRASKAERQVRNYGARQVLRAADFKAAEYLDEISGSTWDEIVESTKDVQNKMRRIVAKANVDIVDKIYKTDLTAEIEKIVQDDSVLSGARAGYVDKLTDVLKAEDASGLGKGLRKFKVEGVKKPLRILSQDTNEYVNALYRLRVAEAEVALSDVAENVKRAEKELPHLREIIENFEATKSPELISAARALEKQGVKFSEAIETARVRLGVMAQDTLDGIKASGFFEDGYMRQQRARTWENYKKQGGKLKISDLRGVQHMGWGDTSAWQDTTLVQFNDLTETAQQYIRKRALETYKELGLRIDVKVSADEVRTVEKINPIRTKVTKNIQNNADTFVRNMDDSIFNDLFDFQKKRQVLRNQEALTTFSGGRVAGAKAKDYKVADRTVKNWINAIKEPEMMRDAIEHHLGKNLSELSTDEINDIIENASARTKRAMRAALKEARDYTGLGTLEKSDLMKIKTSDYTRVTGYARKDAPSWLKPYLSEKQGYALDVIGQQLSPNYMTDYARGTEYIFDDPDELLGAYEAVLTRSSKNAALDADAWADIIGYRGDDIAQNLVLDNYKNIFDNNEVGLRESVAALKRQEAIHDAETRFAENTKKLGELTQKYDLPKAEQQIISSVDELINTAIDNNAANPDTVKALTALGDATASGDDILEYASVKSLVDDKNKILKQFKEAAERDFNTQITADINLKYAKDKKALEAARKNVTATAKAYANEATNLFEDRLMQRFDEITGRLAAQGSDIINKKDYFSEVSRINREIAGATSNLNVVKTYGAYGYEEYVELSPTVANMFTTMPRPLRQGPFGHIQNAFVRTFRFGTTGGLIPGSLINQAFRDTGNAIIAGDAWKSSAQVKRILTEQFGDQVAEYMQRELPDVWDAILAKSEETGRSAIEIAAEREIARGSLNVNAQLESNIYQLARESKWYKEANGLYDRSKFEKLQDTIDDWQKKLETPNNIRETFLRNRVYQNNLVEALQNGMSLGDARTFAEFMQAEATTNFTRQSYHLANLSQTVPYLGAAINGTKSFWRLFSLDPVGITTRMVGGFVVPVIALTAYSLSDEDNRRIYEQIPEYEKEEHLTFVLDKQILTIPIPQEMSVFVTAAQHMVEKMHNANDNSFAELMANDLLGAFPVNLNGFVNIDTEGILTGNLVEDHLIPGFSKTASSLMPPLIKSGFMLWTGVDPYTGNKIDTAWRGTDLETGERTVYDYNSGHLAKMLGNLLGDTMSAQMAQKVLQSLFGNGGMSVIDALGDVASAVIDDRDILKGISAGGERMAKSAISRLTAERYGERGNIAWSHATRQLEAEKEALLTDKDYKDDLAALSNKNLSERARKEVESRVRTRQQEYMNKVLDATNNLINKYGDIFDRYKMLTVISLMNLDEDSINENPNSKLSTYLSDEEVDLNRAIAVETMMNMGFQSTNDSSLFGYYHKNDDGTVDIKYNSPLSILNYKYSSWQQQNIDKVEVTNALKEAKITRSAMFGDEYQKAKKAGKKALKQYKASWNKKVVKTLYPYIKERGVRAFLYSSANRDILDNYIFISNPFKTKEYLYEIFGEKL